MKYFFMSFLFFALLSCKRHALLDNQMFPLFSPDTLMTTDDFYTLGVKREDSVDIDIYVFQNIDTTIRVQYEINNLGSLLSYSWFIPIRESVNERYYIEKLAEKYDVIILDTNEKIMINPQNGMHFIYNFENIDSSLYGHISSGYYCIIEYFSPMYAQHLGYIFD